MHLGRFVAVTAGLALATAASALSPVAGTAMILAGGMALAGRAFGNVLVKDPVKIELPQELVIKEMREKRQTVASDCVLRFKSPTYITAQATASSITSINENLTRERCALTLPVAGACNAFSVSSSSSLPPSTGMDAFQAACKRDGTPVICTSYQAGPEGGAGVRATGRCLEVNSQATAISDDPLENCFTTSRVCVSLTGTPVTPLDFTDISNDAYFLTNFEVAISGKVSNFAEYKLSLSALKQICAAVDAKCDELNAPTTAPTTIPTSVTPAFVAPATNASKSVVLEPLDETTKAIIGASLAGGILLIGGVAIGAVVGSYLFLRKRRDHQSVNTQDNQPSVTPSQPLAPVVDNLEAEIAKEGVYKLVQVEEFAGKHGKVYVRTADQVAVRPEAIVDANVVYITTEGKMLNFQEVRIKNEATYAKLNKKRPEAQSNTTLAPPLPVRTAEGTILLTEV